MPTATRTPKSVARRLRFDTAQSQRTRFFASAGYGPLVPQTRALTPIDESDSGKGSESSDDDQDDVFSILSLHSEDVSDVEEIKDDDEEFKKWREDPITVAAIANLPDTDKATYVYNQRALIESYRKEQKIVQRKADADAINYHTLQKKKKRSDLPDKYDQPNKDPEFPPFKGGDNPGHHEWQNNIMNIAIWVASISIRKSVRGKLSKMLMDWSQGSKPDKDGSLFTKDKYKSIRTRIAGELSKRLPAELKIFVPKDINWFNGLEILFHVDDALTKCSTDRKTALSDLYNDPTPCYQKPELLSAMAKEELLRFELDSMGETPSVPTRRRNLTILTENLPVMDIFTNADLNHEDDFDFLHAAIKKQAAKWKSLDDDRITGDHANVARKKAKLCRFFLKGGCRYGKKCRDSHEISKFVNESDLSVQANRGSGQSDSESDSGSEESDDDSIDLDDSDIKELQACRDEIKAHFARLASSNSVAHCVIFRDQDKEECDSKFPKNYANKNDDDNDVNAEGQVPPSGKRSADASDLESRKNPKTADKVEEEFSTVSEDRPVVIAEGVCEVVDDSCKELSVTSEVQKSRAHHDSSEEEGSGRMADEACATIDDGENLLDPSICEGGFPGCTDADVESINGREIDDDSDIETDNEDNVDQEFRRWFPKNKKGTFITNIDKYTRDSDSDEILRLRAARFWRKMKTRDGRIRLVPYYFHGHEIPDIGEGALGDGELEGCLNFDEIHCPRSDHRDTDSWVQTHRMDEDSDAWWKCGVEYSEEVEVDYDDYFSDHVFDPTASDEELARKFRRVYVERP